MFGKRETEKFDPSDFRVHDRREVRGLKVYVEGQQVEVLDYSEGGVRVASPASLPRVAVIEVYRGADIIQNTAAVTAWSRGKQTGYAFRPKLKLTNINPVSKKELDSDEVKKNSTGGVSGSALRNRLKL